ncbi:MAG TPA: magnesium transporter CorA family protein [Exilispira sp.]|nr:magnesium transporter CorA family protein [Exilispira sp.]
MLNRFSFENNEFLPDENGLIFYFWNLTENEKKEIVEKFDIDIHSINSSLDPDEVSRLEISESKITLIWKIPTALKLGEQSTFKIVSMGFFIIGENLIILSNDNLPYFKEKLNIQNKTIYNIIINLLFLSIKHFIEHLKIIKLLAREIQNKINQSMDNQYLISMFDLSETLIYYLDAIETNHIVLKKFHYFLKNEELPVDHAFFDDIIVENEQASRQAEIYSQVFAGLMDARGTIVNNNMNILIKNLTIINIIFLPLNLISSIFGMSEWTSITKNLPYHISFGIFFLLMILIGWITLIFLSKMEGKRNKQKNMIKKKFSKIRENVEKL